MGYIYQNELRDRLHNKRSEPYGFGKNTSTGQYTDASTADKLVIKTDNGVYALLTEAVYQNDESNFDHISYGTSIDNLTLLPSTSYRVDPESSIVWFDQGYTPQPNIQYYAFYEGEGSIIWVEDITSLQSVVRRIDDNTVYKTGSTMSGDLDMGGFSIRNVTSITNVGIVDNVKISTHTHTGSNYDAPQIDSTGLANGAVQTVKISNDAVTSDKIKDYDVLSNNIGTNAVITSKIADLNVTNSKLANNTIEYLKFNTSNVLSGIFNALYPVGAIYITSADVNTCPIQQYVGTWEKVSSGRVLQGADSEHTAGTTVEAGLPNITGYWREDSNAWCGGAFYNAGNGLSYGSADGGGSSFEFRIDASRSSSVYGNSETVQPPAYVVNIFRRIS